RRRAGGARRQRRAQPDQPAADAGGAVPAQLRRRTRRARAVSGAAGTFALCRTMARRDRTRVAVWVLALGGSLVAAASSVKRLYPTQLDLDQGARATAGSAPARAFKGPPVALATIGGQVAYQIVVLGAVAVALMSLLTVARLTRGEEESG